MEHVKEWNEEHYQEIRYEFRKLLDEGKINLPLLTYEAIKESMEQVIAQYFFPDKAM